MHSSVPHLAGRLIATTGCFVLGVTLPSIASGFDPESRVNDKIPPAMVSLDLGHMLPKLSTLGEGFEYRYRYSTRINLRAEWFTHTDTRARTSENLQSEVLIKLQSRSLLFDWFPFEGRFRATAGVHFFNSDVTGSADYTETLTFPGINLSAAEVNNAIVDAANKLHEVGYGQYAVQLEEFAAENTEGLNFPAVSYSAALGGATAKLHYRPYAPYVGFGWANKKDRRHRWFYSVDVGMMYLGRPRVEYSVSGPLADALRTSYGADLDAWIGEEEREMEDQLRKYRYFPVISFGARYSF